MGFRHYGYGGQAPSGSSGSTKAAVASTGDGEVPQAKLGAHEVREPKEPSLRAEPPDEAVVARRQLSGSVVDALKKLEPEKKPRVMLDIETDSNPNYKGKDFYDVVEKTVISTAEAIETLKQHYRSTQSAPIQQPVYSPEFIELLERGDGALNLVSATAAVLELWKMKIRKDLVDTSTTRDQEVYDKVLRVFTALSNQISKESITDQEKIDEYTSSEAFWQAWQNIITVLYALDKPSALEMGVYCVNNLSTPNSIITSELRDVIEKYYTQEERSQVPEMTATVYKSDPAANPPGYS